MDDWIADQPADDEPVHHLMSAAASQPALIPYLNVETNVAIWVGMAGTMTAQFTNIIYGLILTFVAVLFCRTLTKMDDQAFRIYGLQIQHWIAHFNWSWAFWKPSSYTSNKSRF